MRWRASQSAACVLLLAGLALRPSCAQPERPASAAPEVAVRLQLEGADGRPVDRFAGGEPIELVLTVRNAGDDAFRLPLSSAQSHDFAIGAMDGGELWRWSSGRRFAQQLGELALAPGEERSFRATWQPADPAALPPGRYRAAGWLGGGRERGPGDEREFSLRAPATGELGPPDVDLTQ